MISSVLLSLDKSHGVALEAFLSSFDGRLDECNGYFCERKMPIVQVVHTLNNQSRGEGVHEGWVA